MPKNLIDKIKQFDSFGASFQPVVSTNKKQYQSILGGVLTLAFYGLSLCFFIYNMIEWQNGNNLPKVIVQNKVVDSLGHHFNQVTLTIAGDILNNVIDPFDPQELIFQPVIYAQIGGVTQPIDFIIDLQATNFHSIVFKNFSIQNNPLNDTTQTNGAQILSLLKCVNDTLPKDYRCATQEKIDQFNKNALKFLNFKILIHQFNTNLMNVETFTNELYFLIDLTTTYYSQIILKLQSTTIDDGWLFQNNREITYLNDYTYISQNIPINLLLPLENREIYGFFYLTLSPTISSQFVQYTKINEVLANTGSIISIIFYISFLAKIFNEVMFQRDILHQIISVYYPEFTEISVKYNIFGEAQAAFLNNEQLDKTKFLIFYEKLKTIASEKITLINIIYEISRLQFILQSQQNKENFVKSHKYGIKLNRSNYCINQRIVYFILNQIGNLGDGSVEIYENNVMQELQQNNTQEEENLNLIDSDFDLLSLNKAYQQHI